VTVCRSRRPTLSRRHRHGYAVDNSPWPSGSAITDLSGSSPHRYEGMGVHRSRPRSARFRAGDSLRDVNAGFSRTPLHLACRTRSIWQYWTVPALSRLLPPSPTSLGSGCRQLRLPRCDGARGAGLSPPLGHAALSTAHVVVKSKETGCRYGVGCGWSTGWLIQAVSGSLGGRGRRVKRSGCSA